MVYPLRPNSMAVAPLEKKKRTKWESFVNGIRMSISSPDNIWISSILSPKMPILSTVPWERKYPDKKGRATTTIKK